jgi:tRNA modification GTPase
LHSIDDTIAAIASAPGGAARGIVRLSGPGVPGILHACFRAASGETRAADGPAAVSAGTIVVRGARGLELPADLYYWPTERSYTRQVAAEIHTLGSPPLVAAALETVCAAGARLAEPGEFTLRAFLAGRIDLTQAEAVLGVIDARGEQEFQDALAQLAGGLARPLGRLRDALVELLADLEAGLDFADEDILFVTRDEIGRQLDQAAELVDRTHAQLAQRRRSDQLRQVVLVGWPNVGKSSLFNALAPGGDALVADTPGTTRDYLTATLMLGGWGCQLIDTAGHDPGARAGEIDHAAGQLASAQSRTCDVRLLCLDATRPPNAWEQAALARATPERLVVWTKCDQPLDVDLPPGAIATSARTGTGLDELRRQLAESLADIEPSESAGLTAQRCDESLRAASRTLERARALNATAAGDELVAAELRTALGELGKVAGVVYTDDILDRVFSRFCIGK